MAADTMAASWHPALMPNSHADTIETDTLPTSRIDALPIKEKKAEGLERHEDAITAPIDSTDTPLDEASLSNLANGATNTKDASSQATSDSTHEALPISPSRPETEQPKDAPIQNGITILDTVEDEFPLAEFPPDPPKHENKHLSTMSFARTVSDDVNWGEDDEVDPEWNLGRTDTDPFKGMDKSNRTNSFPAVPPMHSSTAINEEVQVPHSEVEAIMNEVALESKDLFGDEENDDNNSFFNQTAVTESTTSISSSSLGPPTEDTLAGDFGQTVGGDYQIAEDPGSARYEEGIPLVHPSEEPANDYGTPAFLEDQTGEEDDFFAQVSNEKHPEHDLGAPPALERKSTMQIMGSLNPEIQEPIQLIEGEIFDITQTPLDSTMGGGIAVSASTILSEVLGDPNAPIHSQSELLANLGMDSGDGDLAEKWKAALAGDEFLDDDDDDLLPDDEPEEDSTALDPATLFGSDDEGFLEDTEHQNGYLNSSMADILPAIAPLPLNGQTTHTVRPTSSSNRYLPAGASTTPVVPPNNSYAPAASLLADLSRPTISHVATSPYMAGISSFMPPQVQADRPGLPKAQSFANQSKGGYASPYDLPMDVVKPRKRVSMQNMGRGYNPTPAASVPPPRSSSMYTQSIPPSGPPSTLSPPTSSHGTSQNQQPKPPLPQPARANSASSGFFEDLPISTRPKPASRYSSNAPPAVHSSFGPPTGAPPPQLPSNAGQLPFVLPPQQTQHSQPPQQPSGLVAPERVSPYASLPSNPVAPPATMASRYSPAPPALQPHSQSAPPPVSQSRYSPAPPPPMPRQLSQPYAAPPPPPPVLAHQPRTSSPLAHFERNQDARPYGAEIVNDRRTSSSGYESNLRNNTLPPMTEVDENIQPMSANEMQYGTLQPQAVIQPMSQPPSSIRNVSQTPPPPQGLDPRSSLSPPKRTPSANYLPQQATAAQGQPLVFVPPRRSLTQSPGTAFTGPRLDMNTSVPYQRPASVEVPTSPRGSVVSTFPTIAPHVGRPRGFSHQPNYVVPTDGREHDPLQRWKGAPVFAWGVGGTIITSFPKDVPRYGMNQTMTVIRSPGEVKVTNIKTVNPLAERLTSFPGPLKGKSKKKELVSWLTSGIDILEQSASYLRTVGNLTHEDKRMEERVLLWKILRVFIENDGILEGTPAVDKAVRTVLSPGLDDDSTSVPLYATGADLSGISHSANSAPRSDPVDPASVDQLRKHLLRGEREKAVWEAVDKRLWAHAMLISNTVSRDLYKQVAQEFVQKEVKNTGDNTESLAALYEIFAGNFEESIDELVPPSARAGFQMVSTTNTAGPSKDAMDGLDRWRETLGLVLSNRSIDDVQALKALGKLLSGYGRAEAAHICFLFARSVSIFGGIDDPASNMVLVGSDHLRQPYEFDKEMEPILLSEVFEYGMSLGSNSSIAITCPHLSIYKLQHAALLSEYGYRDQALQYCESVAASVTSQTKRSPYHHTLFISALEDLSKRLKQSPKAESSSWISKPSIEKVSGSMWDKLNKFVAGDETDSPDSSAVGASDIGPFSRIAGGTPTISRSPSNSDLYGGYSGGLNINGAGPSAPASKVISKYAPGRTYTPEPPSGSYISQPRSSMEGRSSGEHQRYEPQRQLSSSDYRPGSQPISSNYTPQNNASYAPQSSYNPQGPNHSPYAPQLASPTAEQEETPYASLQPMNSFLGSAATPYTPIEPSFNEPQAYTSQQTSSFDSPTPDQYGPSSGGYEPPSSGYEPPSDGYAPPSYEPAAMGDEPDSPIETRPKKKSFMDDDDDDFPVVKKSSGEKTKAEKDREADEAFRKAAEADAQKGTAAAPAKKGWGIGGWFGGGGKKEPDMSAAPTNKPIRAKLGEQSSFYYDAEQKRWINKKGGDTASTRSATPPPPKAVGPPRTASGPPIPGPTSMPRAPPSIRATSESGKMPSPLSRNDSPPASVDGSPALAPGPLPMSRTVSNDSANGPPSAPPSRPGTGMSNASSIDDLLGPVTGGTRRGLAKKKKGRGYIDVMGEKPS